MTVTDLDGIAGGAMGAGRHRQTRDKVKTLEDLGAIVAEARAAGRQVVHCHGVFDLLHLGHVRHLEEACTHGDMLVVTVTADRYEQQLGIGLAVRKHVLKRRGVIATDAQRKPAQMLTPTARAEVDYLLARVGRRDERAAL